MIRSALTWIAAFTLLGMTAHRAAQAENIPLATGWKIQSSLRAGAAGPSLATPGFDDRQWTQAAVASTILGARVDAGLEGDPFFGTNFRAIPGTTYPVGTDFTKVPTPADSPFHGSWWYRKEFVLPEGLTRAVNAGSRRLRLRLDGLNFRANVWINGQKIGDASDIAGPFRRFELDISKVLNSAPLQALAIEIIPSSPENLALSWVDWAPTPADKNMGLINEVSLESSGILILRDSQIESDLKIPSLSDADLKVRATVENTSDEPREAEVVATVAGLRLAHRAVIPPHSQSHIEFNPVTDPDLKIQNPRVWWPKPLGTPELYHLTIDVLDRGQVSDSRDLDFGIRSFSSGLDAKKHRLFQVNGRKILIRGGGWAPDLFLRWDAARTEAELRYLQHLNLNTVRLEGKLENDRFFEMTDRLGILVLAGWSCCDRWQEGAHWVDEDVRIAHDSLRDQVRRLRDHPSLLAWLYGSDMPPPKKIEKMYLKVLQEERWPNPTLSSASDESTDLTGSTGVKMTGPYEWVAPSYWLTDTGHGGAFGFNTETSPGPAIPPIETLRSFLSPDHLWPIDETWNFHAGGDVFKTVDVFKKALDERYGSSSGIEEFAMKSQVAALESHRAMFEAFGRNKYRQSTGVVQWMLGNPWPSLIWHLYDHELRPGGSYFGARRANEPLHIQYSYDDRSVVIVNDLSTGRNDLQVRVRLLDFSMREVFRSEPHSRVGSDAVTEVLKVPQFEGEPGGPFFLDLKLEDPSGRVLSRNFYWLSSRPEILDFAHSDWWLTPTLQYADYRRLNNLSPVQLVAEATESVSRPDPAERLIRIRITNPSPDLAFSTRLQILDASSGVEILPVFWDDNYFALLPWESREVEARIRPLRSTPLTPPLELRLSGWNSIEKRAPVR